MNNLQTIRIIDLLIAFIPAAAVVIILFKWHLGYKNALYAVARMLTQLFIIGYFLSYIFMSNNSLLILLILIIMVLSSSWIALRTVSSKRLDLYKIALLSIFVGGGITLAIITQVVLNLHPWYEPRYMIPLAGMIFSGSMNGISLAAERFNAEIKGKSYEKARGIAFSASLIPIMNTLFAVGIVSIPGMMTGQILSGIQPIIAARYQIMVILMLFGCSGLSSAIFLTLSKSIFCDTLIGNEKICS